MPFKNGQLLISLSAFLLVVVSLIISRKIISHESKLKEIADDKREYYLLADTMRQTSDDLTKMVRSYVATEDEVYKKYFEEILDIRAGTISRPEEYYKVYWDLVLSEGGRLPRLSKTPISFIDMLKQTNLTNLELELLKASQENSNQLAELEKEAMNAVVGIYKDKKGEYTVKGKPNRELALSLLHSQEYNRAKGKIMSPIMGFFDLIDERTSQEERVYRTRQQRLRVLFNISMGLSVLLVLTLTLFPIYRIIRRRITKKEITKGTLEFFRTNILESWPFATATLTAIFATIMISWWFIGEIREKTNIDLDSRLKLSLQVSGDLIEKWMESKSLETSILAENVKHVVEEKFNNRVSNSEFSELSTVIEERMGIYEKHSSSKFIVLTKEGRVVATNTKRQAYEKLQLPEEIKEKLKTSPHDIYYLNDKISSNTGIEFTDSKVELIFGKVVDPVTEIYLMVAVPINEINSILSSLFTRSIGEAYLVNSEGKLITESKFRNTLLEQKVLKDENEPSIGLRLSTDPKNPNAPLVKSVSNVIEDKDNEDITATYRSYLGIDVIGLWKWDNLHKFGIIREISTDEALGAFNVYRTQTIYASTITVILILLLFSIFAVNRTKLRRANSEINKTYDTIKRQQDRIKRDLVTGQQVQMSMLPDGMETNEFSVDATLKPAQMVSGDFYDFSYVGLNKEKFYFSVGDVSGKGIPAALFMSATKAIINKVIDQQFSTSYEIVTIVNRELCNNNTWCVFVTLVLCVVDLKTGKVELTNAGHNHPVIKQKDGKLRILNNIDGPVLGIFDNVKYTHQNLTLNKGDSIICYTDGITESQNGRQEFYGEDRLTNLLKDMEFNGPKDVIKAVDFDVTRFIKEAPQFDDITLLSFEYKSKF